MFVGREDILASIRDVVEGRSGQTSERVAIVGLGGVG
jgi:hypothetical protein